MPFRLEHITLADRVELGCACLLVAGQYGAMTELAAALGCPDVVGKVLARVSWPW